MADSDAPVGRPVRRLSQTQSADMTTASDPENDEEQVRDHLDDVEGGCGCTEIWEHLSERREADD